jgi:hypothetical protein
VVARSSQDFACCLRAISIAVRKRLLRLRGVRCVLRQLQFALQPMHLRLKHPFGPVRSFSPKAAVVVGRSGLEPQTR